MTSEPDLPPDLATRADNCLGAGSRTRTWATRPFDETTWVVGHMRRSTDPGRLAAFGGDGGADHE
jgi:hypothetical protein